MLSKSRLLVFVALLWSGSAFADCVDVGDGRARCNGTIYRLGAIENGFFRFSTDDSSGIGPLPCTLTGGEWWDIAPDHPMRREWAALLIAAAAANAQLRVISEVSPSPTAICRIQRIEWFN